MSWSIRIPYRTAKAMGIETKPIRIASFEC
jgi:hypothetical protein